jgi:dTMP kinase
LQPNFSGVDSSGAFLSKQGRFITFEGGEGAGKSTQVGHLVARLRARGHEVVATREPGGTPNAEALRKILLEGLDETLSPASEAMIFSAARIDHLDRLIRPALARGAFVICDRFADSTRAYQGGKLPASFIDDLERLAVGDTMPDLTLILDLPAEDGLARADARRGQAKADRFESEAIGFHCDLREAFQKIARHHPQRCRVIDATRPVDVMAENIWSIVESHFFRSGV